MISNSSSSEEAGSQTVEGPRPSASSLARIMSAAACILSSRS